jgi:hypothetical protein
MLTNFGILLNFKDGISENEAICIPQTDQGREYIDKNVAYYFLAAIVLSVAL